MYKLEKLTYTAAIFFRLAKHLWAFLPIKNILQTLSLGQYPHFFQKQELLVYTPEPNFVQTAHLRIKYVHRKNFSTMVLSHCSVQYILYYKSLFIEGILY
jgi:hypothetical protein